MSYYIGIVGSPFCEEKLVKRLVEIGIQEARSRKNELQDIDFDDTIYVVGGLIERGITRFAFKYAESMEYGIVGIDSEMAKNYDSDFKNYTTKYVKGGFGKEDDYFIRNVDVLVVVNPREKDMRKVKLAKSRGIPVIVPADREVVNADRKREN